MAWFYRAEIKTNSMKAFTFICLICCLAGQNIQAQDTTDVISNDNILRLIRSVVPPGWIMRADSDLIIVQRIEQVWILEGNRLNAPAGETREQRMDRVQSKGQKSTAFISFHYEPIWDPMRIEESMSFNAGIYAKIKALPERHGIVELYNPALSSRTEKVYTPKTPKDEVNIAAYHRERAELLASLIRMPDHNTEKYSLFLIEKQGGDDQFTTVFPEEASIELNTIHMLFRELCGR